jgi:hypothetical protein
VPRAADDDYRAVGLLARLADRLTHERFSAQSAFAYFVLELLAHGDHGLGDGVREVDRVRRAVLDDVLPPAFRVVEARGLGEQADGVDVAARAVVTDRRRRRQVEEARGGVVLAGVQEGLPLRGELRERPEGRVLGFRLVVQQDRDRRREGVDVFEERVRLGRPLDQDERRTRLLQRSLDHPGRAGSVVPDAQEDRSGVRLSHR